MERQSIARLEFKCACFDVKLAGFRAKDNMTLNSEVSPSSVCDLDMKKTRLFCALPDRHRSSVFCAFLKPLLAGFFFAFGF